MITLLLALFSLTARADAPVMTYQCSFGLAKSESNFSGVDEVFVDLPIAPLTSKQGEFLPVEGALFGQVTARQRGLLAEFRSVRTDATDMGRFELLLHPENSPRETYAQCWGDFGAKVAGCTGSVPLDDKLLWFNLSCQRR